MGFSADEQRPFKENLLVVKDRLRTQVLLAGCRSLRSEPYTQKKVEKNGKQRIKAVEPNILHYGDWIL